MIVALLLYLTALTYANPYYVDIRNPYLTEYYNHDPYETSRYNRQQELAQERYGNHYVSPDQYGRQSRIDRFYQPYITPQEIRNGHQEQTRYQDVYGFDRLPATIDNDYYRYRPNEPLNTFRRYEGGYGSYQEPIDYQARYRRFHEPEIYQGYLSPNWQGNIYARYEDLLPDQARIRRLQEPSHFNHYNEDRFRNPHVPLFDFKRYAYENNRRPFDMSERLPQSFDRIYQPYNKYYRGAEYERQLESPFNYQGYPMYHFDSYQHMRGRQNDPNNVYNYKTNPTLPKFTTQKDNYWADFGKPITSDRNWRSIEDKTDYYDITFELEQPQTFLGDTKVEQRQDSSTRSYKKNSDEQDISWWLDLFREDKIGEDTSKPINNVEESTEKENSMWILWFPEGNSKTDESSSKTELKDSDNKNVPIVENSFDVDNYFWSIFGLVNPIEQITDKTTQLTTSKPETNTEENKDITWLTFWLFDDTDDQSVTKPAHLPQNIINASDQEKTTKEEKSSTQNEPESIPWWQFLLFDNYSTGEKEEALVQDTNKSKSKDETDSFSTETSASLENEKDASETEEDNDFWWKFWLSDYSTDKISDETSKKTESSSSIDNVARGRDTDDETESLIPWWMTWFVEPDEETTTSVPITSIKDNSIKKEESTVSFIQDLTTAIPIQVDNTMNTNKIDTIEETANKNEETTAKITLQSSLESNDYLTSYIGKPTGATIAPFTVDSLFTESSDTIEIKSQAEINKGSYKPWWNFWETDDDTTVENTNNSSEPESKAWWWQFW